MYPHINIVNLPNKQNSPCLILLFAQQPLNSRIYCEFCLVETECKWLSLVDKTAAMDLYCLGFGFPGKLCRE